MAVALNSAMITEISSLIWGCATSSAYHDGVAYGVEVVGVGEFVRSVSPPSKFCLRTSWRVVGMGEVWIRIGSLL